MDGVNRSSNSSGDNPAWRRMLRKVPTAISLWRGTITTLKPSGVSFANLTWLPFWLTMRNPFASNLRLTSRYGVGLSGTNFSLHLHNFGHSLRGRLFKVEFKRFTQVFNCFLFCPTLTCYINFQALRNEPFALTPDNSGKGLLHHRSPQKCQGKVQHPSQNAFCHHKPLLGKSENFRAKAHPAKGG